MNRALPSVRSVQHRPQFGGRRAGPQPLRHIRLHLLFREELELQHLTQPMRHEFLHSLPQGVPVRDHLGGPVGAEHEQPQGLGAPCQSAQHLHRRGVTPLQVFEHQHDDRLTREDHEGLDELP